MLNKQELIQFEEKILERFENGEIKAPIHLSSNNEEQLIKIFQDYQIGEEDWVCCTWRSHYECLLKGVPPNEIEEAILDKRSISLCFKEYNVISSAIVGGICPIALGIAQALKWQKKRGRVFCFIGDMSAFTGIASECHRYGYNFELPIYWVVADNNKAVCTNTKESWGYSEWAIEEELQNEINKEKFEEFMHIIQYRYESRWPHAGGKKRINF